MTDRPTSFGKFHNGDISATGHPIHFMFGSRVGFSLFRSRRIEWRYFRFDEIQDGYRPPSWKISKEYIYL